MNETDISKTTLAVPEQRRCLPKESAAADESAHLEGESAWGKSTCKINETNIFTLLRTPAYVFMSL
jgi:hypothetical protein